MSEPSQPVTPAAGRGAGRQRGEGVNVDIAQYAAQVGDWPVDLREAGLGSAVLTDKQGRYVESLDVDSAGGMAPESAGR